jgi:uncharacterized membrane protein YeaQ/YmgE (transglycosylase-associated protein family)
MLMSLLLGTMAGLVSFVFTHGINELFLTNILLGMILGKLLDKS